jgi:hypothetical protein
MDSSATHVADGGPYTTYSTTAIHACAGYATDFAVKGAIRHIGAKVTAMVVKLQGSNDDSLAEEGLVTYPALAIGSTPENVANGAFQYRYNNLPYTKAAVSAGTALPSGYDVTTAKYGVIMVYVDNAASPVIQYRFPDTTQAYASAQAAVAAGLALATPPTYTRIGWVTLYNNTGAAWDSNTDDLTDGSDITNAYFVSDQTPFEDMATYTLTATDLNNGSFAFTAVNMSYKYVRLFISSVTGAGYVDADLEIGKR